MIAYITSINEPTTEICRWALDRLGFTTVLYIDQTSLWNKLEGIFEEATDDFLRVDADVIVNKNVLDLVALDELWWYQGMTYDWHKQDVTNGGVQFIRKECIKPVLKHIKEAEEQERPESYLYRLEEFHNPRMCDTYDKVCGLNGYKQNDIQRVKETKLRRGQYHNYDWELAERVSAL
jgi:hypothetical protein